MKTACTFQLLFMNNLDVINVKSDNSLEFVLPDTYMKRIGDSGEQVGLIVKKRIVFGMQYTPESGSKAVDIGRVNIPSLHLSGDGECTRELINPIRDTVTNTSVPYCKVNVFGTYKSDVDIDREECVDRSTCPGRTFLSSYLTGFVDRRTETPITLAAMEMPPDFDYAKRDMVLQAALPGYMPSTSGERAPYQLVKRITVQASSLERLATGHLNCWLDFYNPMSVRLRYFYIHVDTFLSGAKIGVLHINMTRYDPFERKPSYQFLGYPRRSGARKDDPYGPHPSHWCIDQGDCQIAPIDLAPKSNITSSRLEVTFSPTPQMRKLWKALIGKQVNTTVSIRGKVMASIGGLGGVYPRKRYDTGPPLDAQDPYWYAAEHRQQLTTWLDYAQSDTEFVLIPTTQDPPTKRT